LSIAQFINWSILLIIHIYFLLQAGISDDQLTLALEPEAASLYCRKVPVSVESTRDGERKISAMQKGSKYIVFDQGGILLVLSFSAIWTFQIKDNMLPNNIIQLLTFVEVNIRIYRSKIYDIYWGWSRGKYYISWNDRSLY